MTMLDSNGGLEGMSTLNDSMVNILGVLQGSSSHHMAMLIMEDWRAMVSQFLESLESSSTTWPC